MLTTTEQQHLLDQWKWQNCPRIAIAGPGEMKVSNLPKWLPVALELEDVDNIRRVREFLERER